MPAPWCCLIALFEGYPLSHARVCPYRQEPQPDALFPLPDEPREADSTRG